MGRNRRGRSAAGEFRNRLRFTPDGCLVIANPRRQGSCRHRRPTHTAIKRVPMEQHQDSEIQIERGGKRAFIACSRDHYVAVVVLTKLEMTGRIDIMPA
ncbi:MAG TPA: hypothetical protein VK638_21800 [Edaphobacter sp.]|nr:hypothetical protein [Edaphobacter sp.]